MTPLSMILCVSTLPADGFCTDVYSAVQFVKSANGLPITTSLTLCGKMTLPIQASFCILSGLWSGLGVGFWTEYMTSYSYKPVKDIAEASKFGAGPNIIYGLAAGYKSVVVPTFLLATTIFISFQLGDMYGIALAALGMLSTLSTGLSIDAYGPITDNAGGIAEMAGLPSSARSTFHYSFINNVIYF